MTRVLGAHKQELADKLSEFGQILIEYIIIRTKVNLVTGIGFSIALYLVGVQDAATWGILLFILSYVPYIGFILAVLPPVLLALVEINPYAGLIVLVTACLINLFAENILFPELAGRGMNLSPAVVFISMLFWGFLLGGSGVLIAVPLTVLLKMTLESFPETKWIAVLIGSDPVNPMIRDDVGRREFEE